MNIILLAKGFLLQYITINFFGKNVGAVKKVIVHVSKPRDSKN